jgi:hypothetical protein
MGFWLFGFISVVLAVLKLTVAGYWSWWRVMLPFLAFLGHNAVYLYQLSGAVIFLPVFGQPVATRRRTRLEGVLAVFGQIRGSGPVWDVESGGTACVLVADCQRPQSRTCLKPETMRVTFEGFSPTHDFFDYRTSGGADRTSIGCIRIDDLVITLPIVDLSLGERRQHHQVECSLVFGDLPGIIRMLDGKEVFIQSNVEFRGKDLSSPDQTRGCPETSPGLLMPRHQRPA